MRTTSLVLALLVAGAFLSFLPTANASADLDACSSATDGSQCAYMLCWHPHENQYGRVSYCDIGLLWPCQYCVPPEWD